jgi:hypothetical protein
MLTQGHANHVSMCPAVGATQVIVLAAFFHKTADDPGIAAAGLLSAVLGLVLFLDGLRLAIMPMAMQVCREECC